MQKINLYGVWIHSVPLQEAVVKALNPRKLPCLTVTPNALMLDAARREPRYASLLNRATLSLPDGYGVLLAATKKGTPLRERVAGIDFGEEILHQAAKRGLRVFLLGGRIGVARQAAKRLTAQIPNLKICGTYHGYFAKKGEENERVLRYIRACKPDILFVCFGFPRQELWSAQSRHRLPSLRLIACLGGSLDVWAGNRKRAPAFLARHGLEWAWRMLQEPRRLMGLPALARIALGI